MSTDRRPHQPNPQSVPRPSKLASDLRRRFVADRPVIISVDYSQFELRALAVDLQALDLKEPT